MAKHIEITFKVDGTCNIEGKEFKGPDCEKATKEIESVLGTVTGKTFKPEHKQGQNQQIKR
jgi:hypothetical protein